MSNEEEKNSELSKSANLNRTLSSKSSPLKELLLDDPKRKKSRIYKFK